MGWSNGYIEISTWSIGMAQEPRAQQTPNPPSESLCPWSMMLSQRLQLVRWRHDTSLLLYFFSLLINLSLKIRKHMLVLLRQLIDRADTETLPQGNYYSPHHFTPPMGQLSSGTPSQCHCRHRVPQVLQHISVVIDVRHDGWQTSRSNTNDQCTVKLSKQTNQNWPTQTTKFCCITDTTKYGRNRPCVSNH